MDKNKTLTEAANDLIEHAMEQGIPARMVPFVEALRVAKNERKAESDAARLEIASLQGRVNECGAGAGCCAQAARIEELEAQLEAVGAGGVGPLVCRSAAGALTNEGTMPVGGRFWAKSSEIQRAIVHGGSFNGWTREYKDTDIALEMHPLQSEEDEAPAAQQNALAPCPFCGDPAQTDHMPEIPSFQVECSDSIGCTARVTRGTQEEAEMAWNRRWMPAAAASPEGATFELWRAASQAQEAQDDAVAQAVAAEREACAQLAAQTVCDLHIPTGVKIYGSRAAKAIRARGTDAAKPAAQAQPRDDAVFVFWWSDHMPNSTEADAWAEWCALRSNQPAAQAQEDAGGWMRDGGMLYRLTDERRPTNFDEIRVTMANGSRDIGQTSSRAERLLVMLSAPQPAAQAAPVEAQHSTACLYHYALSRLGLRDNTGLRVLFWDAHNRLSWDSETDWYVTPDADKADCGQCNAARIEALEAQLEASHASTTTPH